MNGTSSKGGATPQPRADVGQIAAIVGVGSALSLFIAAVFTWSFVHGLLGVLGFPSQVISLKTAVDAFPSVAVDTVGGLCAFLLLGFVTESLIVAFLKTNGLQSKQPLVDNEHDSQSKDRAAPKRKRKSSEDVIKLVCAIVMFLTAIPLTITVRPDTQSVAISALLLTALLVATLFIGISYQLFRGNDFACYFMTGVFSTLALLLGTSYMFQHGRDIGAKLTERSDFDVMPVGGYGVSSIKASDFPLVALTSKEKLALDSAAETDGKTFTYQSQGADNFIRLIVQDENNYYVIEHYGGAERPMAIRKEIVSEIVFLKPR